MKIIFKINDDKLVKADIHPEDKIGLVRNAIADAFCVDQSKIEILRMEEPSKQKEGVCPNCQSSRDEDLDYGIAEFTAGHMSYPYICKACGFEGIEHHRLEFECHTNKKNEDLE